MTDFFTTWFFAGIASLIAGLAFMDSIMNYLESDRWAIKLPPTRTKVQLALLFIAAFGGTYIGISIAEGFAQVSANLSCLFGECINKAVFAASAPKHEPLVLGIAFGFIPTCMARSYYMNAYHSHLRQQEYNTKYRQW